MLMGGDGAMSSTFSASAKVCEYPVGLGELCLKNQAFMLISYTSYYFPLCSVLGTIILINRLLCLEFNK